MRSLAWNSSNHLAFALGGSASLAHTPGSGLPPGGGTFPWRLLSPAGPFGREFSGPACSGKVKVAAV